MRIRDLFRRRAEEETPAPQTEESASDVLLKAILRGETIDKDKAMSLPAVASAVDRICNTVAMIPIRLYREVQDEKTGKTKVEEVKDDPRI